MSENVPLLVVLYQNLGDSVCIGMVCVGCLLGALLIWAILQVKGKEL